MESAIDGVGMVVVGAMSLVIAAATVQHLAGWHTNDAAPDKSPVRPMHAHLAFRLRLFLSYVLITSILC